MVSTFALTLALTSAVLHATWNLLARGNQKRELLIQVSLFFGAAIAIPFSMLRLFLAPDQELGNSLAGLDLSLVLGSAVCEVLYLFCLTRAYATGKLAETYTVARGSAPVLVALAGSVFFGKQLPYWSWIGIAMVTIGLAALKQIKFSRSFFAKGSAFFLYALGAGVFIAGFTLVDSVAVHQGDPLLFKSFVFLLMGLGMTFLNLPLYQPREMISFARQNPLICLITGLIMFFGYGLMLFAIRAAEVSVIAPMRETSIVFALFMGWAFLKEKPEPRQMFGVFIVVLGVLALRFS
jgi:drug/metabolite transporter (DMT)-like permease